VWDDFCSWYLEIIKPEFTKPIDRATYEKTIEFFETVLRLLHPFMPFITEELWHELKDRKDLDCIITAPWPTATSIDQSITEQAAFAFEVITEIRNMRNSKGLSPKEALPLSVKKSDLSSISLFTPIIQKLANVSRIDNSDQFKGNGAALMVRSIEFFIPLEGKIDIEKERETLKKELDYTKGFLSSINKKLENEKFVSGAPQQVLEIERKKKSDAEIKIRSLEQSLKNI
jgi:valyl-tRNA synthetase